MSQSNDSGDAVLRDVRIRSQMHRLVPPGLARSADRSDTGSEAGRVDRAAARNGPVGPVRAHREASPEQVHEEAWKAGYQAGYDAGHESGRESGYESGHEAARQAGEQAGREAGLAAGRQAGTQEMNELIKAATSRLSERAQDADRLLAGLEGAVAQRLQAVEADLVELAYGAVCRIIGMAAFAREGVQALILQALSGLPARTLQAIRVSPHDHAWIEADANWKLQVLGARAGEVQWLADERVARGGCIIVSADGSLDARLDTQLRQFRDLLLEVHHAAGHDSDGRSGDGRSSDGHGNVARTIPPGTEEVPA